MYTLQWILYFCCYSIGVASLLNFDHTERDVAFEIHEASEIPKRIPCGSTFSYWSTSCGPITTASSRFCSHGGEKINKNSCFTHFNYMSRGCSFAKLGCQSACIRTAPPCEGGDVSFISRNHFTSNRIPHIALVVSRLRGSDGNGSVTVATCNFDQQQYTEINPSILNWSDDEDSPRAVSVKVDTSIKVVKICLKDPHGLKLGPMSSSNIHVVTLAGTVSLKRQHFRARESDRFLTVELERSGNLAGSASVRLIHFGGSAIPVVDYVPFDEKITWMEQEGGIKEFNITIHANMQPEYDETIFLALTGHSGCGRGDPSKSRQYAIATIEKYPKDIDSGIDGDMINIKREKEKELRIEESRKKQIETLAYLFHFQFDPQLLDDFLASFHILTVPAGTIVAREGESSSEYYIIKEGLCEKWSTFDSKSDNLFSDVYEAELGARVGSIGPGGTYGLFTALFNTKVRGVTLRCIRDTTLYVVDRRNLRRYALNNEEVRNALMRKELKDYISNLKHKNPLLLFPGFMSSRLVAWKRKACRGFPIEVFDHVWLSIEKLMQTLISDKNCWLDCLRLDKRQLDPCDCKVRAMDGIEALVELAPGVFTGGPSTIYGDLMKSMALEFGYDITHIVPFSYDWRLSPDQMETRDGFFHTTKRRIEAVVNHSGRPAIVVGHSQGNLVFLQFVDFMEQQHPQEWRDWLDKHILSYYALGAPLLGSLDPIIGTTSGSNMGLPITDSQSKNMALTFGSMAWFLPFSDKWHSDIVGITDKNGKRTPFNSEAIIRGDYFRYLNRTFNDSRFLNQVNYLERNYHSYSLNPLRKNFDRPPIRNVIVMYGVNLPTDYSAEYEQVDGEQEPVLKHVVVENENGILRNKNTAEKLGRTTNDRSGDETVPYLSLSHAQTWHVGETTKTHYPEHVFEYYDFPLGRWGEKNVFSVMNRIDPAYTLYNSEYIDNVTEKSFHTSIYEIEKMGHRNIVKKPFVHELIQSTYSNTIQDEIKNYLEEQYGSTTTSDFATTSTKGEDTLHHSKKKKSSIQRDDL